MRILVTGSAGFIGSHICDALIEQNHDVFGYDSLEMGVDFTPKGMGGTKYNHALTDLITVAPNTDLIVHCAARADVAQNWTNRDERKHLTVSNILGTEALLEAAQGIPVIMLSTCAVYGDDSDCQEDRPCIATSPYAASKLAGEAMVQAYAFKAGAPWHVFRLGCAVGDRYHHGHAADFVAMGNHYAHAGMRIRPKSDGLTKKSCVHVLDIASAVVMAAHGELGTGIYNLASGAWSPRDTIRVMGAEDIIDWPVDKTHGWIGDPMAVASGQKVRSAGWVPKHSIEQGIREALAGLGWKSGLQ